jgi:nitronate monooxygenase
MGPSTTPAGAGPGWATNRLTELLGIRYPIVSGAFGGLSSVELTGAVSDAGALGAYGLYGYTPERILETAEQLRRRTRRPFLLNLWVTGPEDETPDITEEEFAEHVERLRPLFEELDLPLPGLPERFLPSFADQVDALIEARPAVGGFVFGVPDEATVHRLHGAGIAVVGTATTAAEAVALQTAGADAVIASGAEAGGHKPSFLAPAEENLIGTFALVPQVADAVSVPVIAAGGVADGRGVAAALLLGAAGVQVGTAFLATTQSAASPAYRAVLTSERARSTVLTRASSGRLARGVPNRLTREIQETAPFPVQNHLTGFVRRAAAERDDPELLALWSGQAAPLVRERDAAELVRRLVSDTTRLLASAAAP